MNHYMRLVKLKLCNALLSGELNRVVLTMVVIHLGLATFVGDVFFSGHANAQGLMAIWPLSFVLFVVVFWPSFTAATRDADWIDVEPVSRLTRVLEEWSVALKMWTLSLLCTVLVLMPWVISVAWDPGLVAAGLLSGVSLGMIGLALNQALRHWIRSPHIASLAFLAIVGFLSTVDHPVWVKGLQLLVGTPVAELLTGLSLYRHISALSSGYLTLQDLAINLSSTVVLLALARVRPEPVYWHQLSGLKRAGYRSIATLAIIALIVACWAFEHFPTSGVDVSAAHRYTLNSAVVQQFNAHPGTHDAANSLRVSCLARAPSADSRLLWTPQVRRAVMINDQLASLSIPVDACKPEARVFNQISLVIATSTGSVQLNAQDVNAQSPSFWSPVLGSMAAQSGYEPLTLGVLVPKELEASIPERLSSGLGAIIVINLANHASPTTVVLRSPSVDPTTSPMAIPSDHVQILSDQLPWDDASPPTLHPDVEAFFKTDVERQNDQQHSPQQPVIGSALGGLIGLIIALTITIGALWLTRYLVARKTYARPL